MYSAAPEGLVDLHLRFKRFRSTLSPEAVSKLHSVARNDHETDGSVVGNSCYIVCEEDVGGDLSIVAVKGDSGNPPDGSDLQTEGMNRTKLGSPALTDPVSTDHLNMVNQVPEDGVDGSPSQAAFEQRMFDKHEDLQIEEMNNAEPETLVMSEVNNSYPLINEPTPNDTMATRSAAAHSNFIEEKLEEKCKVEAALRAFKE